MPRTQFATVKLSQTHSFASLKLMAQLVVEGMIGASFQIAVLAEIGSEADCQLRAFIIQLRPLAH